MKISALCPTYNRPRLLGQAIAMFLAQDYPDKELIILDDAGQYGDLEGPSWRIVSTTERYPSVAAKRNALVKLASGDAIAVWDDDDWYFPWALSAIASALDGSQWVQPRQALEWDAPGVLGRYWTIGRDKWKRDYCYSGSWAFRRALLEANPYPEDCGNGEDTVLGYALWRKGIASADAVSTQYPLPFYVYSRERSGSWHASELGEGFTAYPIIGAMPREDVRQFRVELPAGYAEASQSIPQTIKPRKW